MNDESQDVSGKLDCGLFVPFYVMVLVLVLDCFCFLSFVVPVEPLSGALTYSLLLSFSLCDMMTDACTNKRTHEHTNKHTMTTDTCIPMNDESQGVSGKLDCGLFVHFYVMVLVLVWTVSVFSQLLSLSSLCRAR